MLKALFELANQNEGRELYLVTVVSSGVEALAAMQAPLRLKPDLILLDTHVRDRSRYFFSRSQSSSHSLH